MSLITRLALRRIKRNIYKSVFLMLSVLFSMLVISFFAFFQLQTSIAYNPDYDFLPLGNVLGELNAYMKVTVVFLLIFTFAILRINCYVQGEENRQTLAVLTSVGATKRQKRRLLMTETALLYLPPLTVGAIIGIFPGIMIGNSFKGVTGVRTETYAPYALLAAVLILGGMALIMLNNFLPEIKFKRKSVISDIRKQNAKETETRHGYMQSKTYREQSLLKRLAQRSVKYYSRTYNAIACSIVLTALYPILAVILFLRVVNIKNIVIDENPYDAIDTSAAVYAVIYRLLLFLCLCFLVLTVIGFIQTLLIIRTQYARRRKTALIYLTVGMPEGDIKKLIANEFISLGIKVFCYLLFITILVYICFLMVAGGI